MSVWSVFNNQSVHVKEGVTSLIWFSDNGLGVPVVLLALEGGVDTIVAAKNAVQHHIPIVVCEGTGRAADIIAFAQKHAKLMG